MLPREDSRPHFPLASGTRLRLAGSVVSSQLTEPIQFGKYSLFELIGRGGMAEVYKGRIQGPAGFERTFVVKRILPHLSDDTTFIKMFVEEAKLSARLAHPNIVHIFELGAVDGEYFISMEYIRGHDLSETMRAIWKTMGPPRPEMVAYIGREACRGLSYAHGLTDENGRLAGDGPPRHLAVERDAVVRRGGQAARLRDRQGARRRARDHQERHHEGEVRLHGARADRGGPRRQPQRHLRLRDRPARGAHRPAALQGRTTTCRPSSACVAARCRRRRCRTRPCRRSWTRSS